MPAIETGWLGLSCEEAGAGDPPPLLIQARGGRGGSFAGMMPRPVAAGTQDFVRAPETLAFLDPDEGDAS